MSNQVKTYDAAEYRGKINELMERAPGYLLAIVYGFLRKLMEAEQ